jgi:sigma-E factor negative regulatory protein RseB
MTRKLLLLAFCIVVMPTSARCMTAVQIARRAQDAGRHVSYRGVKNAFVLVNKAPYYSTIKVVHTAPDMTRKDFYSPARLAGTVVIQSGPDVWKYAARERYWEKVPSAEVGPKEAGQDAAFGNYEVRLVGSDRVAGRAAYVLKATPKGNAEPRRMLWVDKSCYLVLKTRAETPERKLLSSSEYTSIAINPGDISPSVFEITGKVKCSATPAHVSFRVLKPSYLPRGYKMVGVTRTSAAGHPCAHLQFSNGVNSISLFERKCCDITDAPRVPESFTSIVTWARDGMLLTLIGETGRAELKRIANSTK